jgi:hypothetical protein
VHHCGLLVGTADWTFRTDGIIRKKTTSASAGRGEGSSIGPITEAVAGRCSRGRCREGRT